MIIFKPFLILYKTVSVMIKRSCPYQVKVIFLHSFVKPSAYITKFVWTGIIKYACFVIYDALYCTFTLLKENNTIKIDM